MRLKVWEWAIQQWNDQYILKSERSRLLNTDSVRLLIGGPDQQLYHLYLERQGDIVELEISDPTDRPEIPSASRQKYYSDMFEEIVKSLRFTSVPKR